MAEIGNDKKREIAEDMYIRLGLTGREIAENLGVQNRPSADGRKAVRAKNRGTTARPSTANPAQNKRASSQRAEKLAKGEESLVKADQLR